MSSQLGRSRTQYRDRVVLERISSLKKKKKSLFVNNNYSEDNRGGVKTSTRGSSSTKSLMDRRSREGIHKKSVTSRSSVSSASSQNGNESSGALSSPRVGANRANGIKKKSCFAQQLQNNSNDYSESDADSCDDKSDDKSSGDILRQNDESMGNEENTF